MEYIESIKCDDCGINCDLSKYRKGLAEYIFCPICHEKITGQIIIQDWIGNVLFEGHYEDEEVDKVLDANRCDCDYTKDCSICDETGYKVEIEAHWKDKLDKRNVYEYINY